MRSGWHKGMGALLLAFLAAMAVFLPALEGAGDEPADPLPIARILLEPEQLDKAVERLGRGVLMKMSRAEFEGKVRKAARAAANQGAPRLLEAVYHASLVEGALSGRLEWKVLNPGPGAALWDLQPLNVALRQPRFENEEAFLADFAGRGSGLLLDKPGRRSVFVEWSLRGENRPEGLYFALEVPSAPVAHLELDLPLGQVATVLNEAVLVTGPHPTEQGNTHQRWQIACGGRSQLNLLVRQTTGSVAPALIVKKQRTTQHLTPGVVEAVYEFDLAVLHQPAREVQCECDPQLRPYEVTLRNRETGWELRPPAGPGKPARLVIDTREPFWEGTLVVRCFAPLPIAPAGPTVWSSPALRVAQGVQRGETIALRIHPDLHLQDWQPGGFRLTEAAAEPDRWQRMVLEGGGVQPEGAPPGTPPRRPSARLRAGGVAYRARQLSWWQLSAARASLTLQIAYEVQNGKLFQLPVLLPPGWEVERVEMNPPALLRNWTVQPPALPVKPAPASGRATLLVDLHKPLTLAASAADVKPGGPPRNRRTGEAGRPPAPRPHPAVLTVRLHAAQPLMLGRELPFPDAEPVGARLREGALAIEVDEQMVQAGIKTTMSEGEPEDDSLWGSRTPDHFFPYSGQPAQGTLVLRPRPPLLRARCNTDVFLALGRAGLEARLTLETEVGSTDAVVVRLPSGTGPLAWRAEQQDNAVRRAERLPDWENAAVAAGVAAGHPLRAAILLAPRAAAELWRLTLARPLRAREPLVLLGSRNLDRVGPMWQVPLPGVVGADRMEGEVVLHLAGAEMVKVEASGLLEAPASTAPARSHGATAWRTFRYGAEPASLRLRGQPALAAAEASADNVHLTTFVGLDGLLRHHFTFEVANWPQRRLPLSLPPGARPVAARSDGRWLVPLPLSETEEEGAILELPVPDRANGETSGDIVHRFEVVYTTTTDWSVFARVEAPAPVLPVAAPVSFRRTWRLPPGVSPVFEGRQRRLPGPGEGYEPHAPGRWPTDLFRLSATQPRRPVLSRQSQAQALAEAVRVQGSSRGGQVLPLGEALEQLAFYPTMQPWALLVDAAALGEAGVTADRLVKIAPSSPAAEYVPPWNSLDLTVLHTADAVLVTTRRQAALWSQALGETTPLSPALDAALAQAARHGQDASGRFRGCTSWAERSGRGRVETSAGPVGPLLDSAATLNNWTAWEPRPGTGPDVEIIVVRRDMVSLGGVALAVLLVVGMGRPRPRAGWRRVTYLMVWLAGAGLALLWLPAALEYLAWWPLVVGIVFGLAWYARAAVRSGPVARRAPSTASPANPAVAGLLVLFATTAWSFQETGPAGRFAVFLLPGPAQAPEQQSVWAPAELMDRLRDMARAPAVPAPGAYLLSAAYEGKLLGNEAEFHVVFHVLSTADGPAVLALPLGGPSLRLTDSVLLDGAHVLPTALPSPQHGFTVNIPTPGRHKVELTFFAHVTEAAPERQVQFSAPRLAQNQLRFTVPGNATIIQALARQGGQRVTASAAGTTLDVALGRVVSPVTLRWQQQASAVEAATVQFREAYLWDLGVGSSSLTCLLDYTVSQGAVASLAIDLPPELEVHAVEAHRSGSGPPIRVRDTRIAGAGVGRALRLDFAGPVRGEFQVALDLHPAAPLAADLALPLPAPRGQALPGGSFLAYRANGLAVQRTSLLRVTGVKPEEFARSWSADSRPDPRTLAYACTIRREPGAPPVLRLRLQQAPPALVVEQKLILRAGARQADLEANLALTAAATDFALVECQVSGPLAVMVTAVTALSGPQVSRWYQTDDKLLIWLARAAGAVRLKIVGWSPLAPAGAAARLDLPRLRVVGAQKQETTLRLEPAAGSTLHPEVLSGLKVVPGAPPADRVLSYQTSSFDYSGRFLLRPEGAGATARVLTFAEIRERRLTFTAEVVVHAAQGELRSLKVRLRNWTSDDTRLEADKVAQQQERQPGGKDRIWALTLQPGVKGTYRLSLTGSVPVEAAAGLAMPDVTVSGVDKVEYWLALGGSDLQGEGAAGLDWMANPLTLLAGGMGSAERLRHTGGSAWKVTAADWRLRLVPRARPVETGPPQVFLAEQTAAVVDGRRWLHEAVLWLRHEANTDLTFRLPGDAEVLSVAVDGVEAIPLQPRPDRLWLPLPGQAGLRHVRLQWRFVNNAEPFDRPNLKPPLPEGMEGLPAVWTVLVPPGWTGVAAGAGLRLESGLAPAARVQLYRAEAQIQVSKDLSALDREGTSPALAPVQQRFYSLIRLAEADLKRAGSSPEVEKSDGPLADWSNQLLALNQELARSQGFEELRAEAQRHGPLKAPELGGRPNPGEEASPLALPRRGRHAGLLGGPAAPGTPYYGANLGTAESKGRFPQFGLVPADPPRDEATLNASVQWLGLLGGIWLLSFFPSVLALARRLWPEQLALVGAGGWYVEGQTPLALALLGLAALARGWYVASWCHGLLRGWFHTATAAHDGRSDQAPPESPSHR